MTRMHFIQHVPFEGMGYIETFAVSNGFMVSGTRVYEKNPFPETDAYDWLVIMGGPMGVHDERIHPWIIDEKKCIERAIHGDKKVLGICLGAQLIAIVLGAKVYANPVKEIGWFPVTLTGHARTAGIVKGIPDRFTAFHWHGDTFDIPRGALHIAVSDACANQAFVYGDKVTGLQFHCESTVGSITGLIDNCGDEIREGPSMQTIGSIRSNMGRVMEINATMDAVLSNIMHSART
jgi:GMP synthase-like glutamine amidotransferase